MPGNKHIFFAIRSSWRYHRQHTILYTWHICLDENTIRIYHCIPLNIADGEMYTTTSAWKDLVQCFTTLVRQMSDWCETDKKRQVVFTVMKFVLTESQIPLFLETSLRHSVRIWDRFESLLIPDYILEIFQKLISICSQRLYSRLFSEFLNKRVCHSHQSLHKI